MAIPTNKTRLSVTIHKETKELLDQLLSLHDNLNYSNLIEVAILFYAKAVESKLNAEEKENKGNANN